METSAAYQLNLLKLTNLEDTKVIKKHYWANNYFTCMEPENMTEMSSTDVLQQIKFLQIEYRLLTNEFNEVRLWFAASLTS